MTQSGLPWNKKHELYKFCCAWRAVYYITCTTNVFQFTVNYKESLLCELFITRRTVNHPGINQALSVYISCRQNLVFGCSHFTTFSRSPCTCITVRSLFFVVHHCQIIVLCGASPSDHCSLWCITVRSLFFVVHHRQIFVLCGASPSDHCSLWCITVRSLFFVVHHCQIIVLRGASLSDHCSLWFITVRSLFFVVHHRQIIVLCGSSPSDHCSLWFITVRSLFFVVHHRQIIVLCGASEKPNKACNHNSQKFWEMANPNLTYSNIH